MTRISTANSYSAILNDLGRAQMRQVEANSQIASGKKADSLKGYAREAQTLTAMRGLSTRIEGFLAQSQILVPKVSAQELALTTTTDAAESARQSILDALAANSGTGLKSQLEAAFSTAAQGLNTQYNGVFLFAGGKTNTPPAKINQMADLTSGTVADAFDNDDFKVSNRLDETTTLKTGMLADEIGTELVAAFHGVQTFLDANGGDFPAVLNDAQKSFLSSMLDDFDKGRKTLTMATAENGLNQKRLDDSIDSQSRRGDLITGMIGDLADVDMTEAISNLQQAQVAVEASARVFSALQASSLINFLR